MIRPLEHIFDDTQRFHIINLINCILRRIYVCEQLEVSYNAKDKSILSSFFSTQVDFLCPPIPIVTILQGMRF